MPKLRRQEKSFTYRINTEWSKKRDINAGDIIRTRSKRYIVIEGELGFHHCTHCALRTKKSQCKKYKCLAWDQNGIHSYYLEEITQ